MIEGAGASKTIGLKWHADWVTSLAHEKALVALAEMTSDAVGDVPTLQPWERLALDLSRSVQDAMASIEEPEFVAEAQIAIIAIFLRHLDMLVSAFKHEGTGALH